MGMFDELRCEYPLPELDRKDVLFQTKNLGRNLDQFKIDQDGLLWRRENHDPAKFFEKYGQELEWFRFGVTRDVTFYAKVDEEWVEYEGCFINGKMIAVTKIKWADTSEMTQDQKYQIVIEALRELYYLNVDDSNSTTCSIVKRVLSVVGEIPLNE